MTHVVYFACPGLPSQDVQSKYRAALAPLGDVSLVWLARAGLSSVFTQWANGMKRDGRILPELLRQFPPPNRARPASVSMISFSAGYGFVRELLKHEEDRAAVDALVLLDSLHAGLDPDDTADDMSLQPFVTYAKAARHGACRFWSAYTDVETSGYASTTKSNDELVRLAGGLSGDFWVREYNLYGANQQKREHGAALTEWGPGFVGEALVPWIKRVVPPETTELPLWQDPRFTLAERCCAFLGSQVPIGVKEIPGPRHDPRILEYSKHCRRGGKFSGVDVNHTPLWVGGAPLALGTDEDAWCAALASGTLFASLLPGEAPSHGLRVSVRELVEDARLTKRLRVQGYEPKPGDLALYARDGGDPLKGGRGHVRRVIRAVGEQYYGIGGNELNQIITAWHPLAEADSRGWIEV